MKIKAGLAEKDGIKFAVVQTDLSMVDVSGRARDMVERLKDVFPDISIVLMTRDKKGSPIFYGRPDIVNGLGGVALRNVEWNDYDVNMQRPD